MNKCNIFLSKEENYQASAEKIKNSMKMPTKIIWIEDFMKEKNKKEKLENSIIYFLCNSELIKILIKKIEKTNCYIYNKNFFEKNYNKLEIQQILKENQINTPKIFNVLNTEKIELPVFCKENSHAGMVFEIYTKDTINKFFKKFKSKNFYLEESIKGKCETKFYYVNRSIFDKNNNEIPTSVKKICMKVSKSLELEIFSIDMIQKESDEYVVIDVNPSSGFYMQDEARNKLIKELEK